MPFGMSAYALGRALYSLSRVSLLVTISFVILTIHGTQVGGFCESGFTKSMLSYLKIMF